jgi:hypothetical protein
MSSAISPAERGRLEERGAQVHRSLDGPGAVDARDELNVPGDLEALEGGHQGRASFILAIGWNRILEVDADDVRAAGERRRKAVEHEPSDKERRPAVPLGMRHHRQAACVAFSMLS